MALGICPPVACTACPVLAAAAASAATWLRALFDTTVQATVPSTASPIAPPTCWPVLSRLEASPASRSWTLDRATRVSGMNSMPSPAAVTIIGPSRPPA